MIRRVGIFLLGTLAGSLVMYLPMGYLVGQPSIEVIALAAAICVVPGVLVLVAARRLKHKAPEVRIVGVLLSTAVRMVMAVGGGVLLYAVVPELKEHGAPFISWVIVFYLITLFIETGLLYTDNLGSKT